MRSPTWLFVALAACATPSPPATPAERAAQMAGTCLDEGRGCEEAAAWYASQPAGRQIRERLAALRYRACLGGSARACHDAAGMFERGEVKPPNPRRVRAMFEHVCHNRFPFDPGACTAGALYGRACEGRLGEACAALAALHGSGRLGRRSTAMARSLHRRACLRGHRPSCTVVASALARTDPAAAAKLLASACDGGDMAQCVALADLLERGAGIDRDLPRARALRKRACDAKHGGACSALAGMWQKGIGGERGKSRALALYAAACELDEPDACLSLARAHATGEIGEADMAAHYELSGKAAKLYGPACEAGDAHACHVLGSLHRQGGGVREDRALGIALQKRACEAGYGAACIAFLQRGPHRVSIKSHPKMARAVSDACREGEGAACFAVGWIGRRDLESAGARPPAHPYSRGCRVGHPASCNALGIAAFPPSQAGMAALAGACDLGYAPACHHLGVAKEMRADVEADEEAVIAYGRGCGLDWAPACTRLGMMRRQGHVTPGAMSASAAFEKACEGGDPSGCYELGLLMRGQSGGDGKVGMRLLERACQKGHVASCADLGERLLATGAREAAIGKLESACTRGGSHACVVLADALAKGDEQKARRKTLLEEAITGATNACDDGLAVCGTTVTSRAATPRWASYEGAPARELGDPPACGIALERACLVVRDAHVKMCDLTKSGKRCFDGGAAIRKLASAGLSIGVADAKRVEEAGFAAAEKGCRKNNALACEAVAASYRSGRGVEADDKKADRYQKRACRLDETRCPPSE